MGEKLERDHNRWIKVTIDVENLNLERRKKRFENVSREEVRCWKGKILSGRGR